MEQKKEQRVVEKTWTETLESIKDGITATFPHVPTYYELGEGTVALLENNKSKYRIGVVFPVKYKETGEIDHIVYFPIKGDYILASGLKYKPVNLIGQKFSAKRGDFEVKELKGRQAFAFHRIYNTFVEL